jgi:hypothetical protein
VIVRKRSWPAVSHYAQRLALVSFTHESKKKRIGGRRTIWSLMVLPSSSIVRIFWARVTGKSNVSNPDRISVYWTSTGPSRQSRDEPARGTHEVHANSRDVALRVRVIRETEQQTRLADARVTDQQQLEQVVTAQHNVVAR